jgi:hypothetical protein
MVRKYIVQVEQECSRISILILLIVIAGSACILNGQEPNRMKNRIKIAHITTDFGASDLYNKNWDRAESVDITRYWSDEGAPDSRQFKASLLWSDTALYVRFEANQGEPLVVSEKPKVDAKTMKLWDRDVCEIFVAPDKKEPRKYFEFEVAPTGEWIDVTIDLTSGERVTGWDYRSGMQSAAKIEKDKVVMAIKVDWKAVQKKPKTGDVWLGNLFRCVGKDPTRGYLAWQPTMTKEPAFHVPEKFGQFEFVN